MLLLFPDTNFFLHCKDASSLNWVDITRDLHIKLMVCRTIQRELDRLKQDGNPRRSKKARDMATTFRDLIRQPSRTSVILDANPRVELSLSPSLDPARVRPANLDPNHADDRFIEEVLSLSTIHPDSSIAVLTDDTHVMLTATEHGLTYIAMPDAWRLPNPPDERDKTILDLRRQIDELQSSHPRVEVKARDSEGIALQQLHLRPAKFEPLSPDQLSRLTTRLKQDYPEECLELPAPEGQRTAPYDGITGHLFPDTDDGFPLALKTTTRRQLELGRRITAYKSGYMEWIKSCRHHLSILHRTLETLTNTKTLSFVLENNGSRPAEGLIVTFATHGGFTLTKSAKKGDTQNEKENNSRLPLPPEPPSLEGRELEVPMSHVWPRTDAAFQIGSYIGREVHDPYAFYCNHRDDGVIEYSCDEFRHKEEPEVFYFDLSFQPNEIKPSGVIEIRVSARNIPTPTTTILKIIAIPQQHSLDIRVEQLLSDLEMRTLRLRSGP